MQISTTMSILISVATNATHYQLWVGKQDHEGSLCTLWKHALKACWCLEQADNDLPGLCKLPRPLDFIDYLHEVMPYTAERIAHLFHLFSDENLSMYSYEESLQNFFYASAPILLIFFYSALEDRGGYLNDTGRRREHLFTNMVARCFYIYLGHKIVKAPFYLNRVLQEPSESGRMQVALDLWTESMICDSLFVYWSLFIMWAADFLIHQETLAQNLRWHFRNVPRGFLRCSSDLPLLAWH